MLFQVNDLVTRNSYNNDIVFRIAELNNDIALLKGIAVRLIADSHISDLRKYEKDSVEDIIYDQTVTDKILSLRKNKYL